jgi:uncharacterized membrane protein YbhN (UPF0104 family)
VPADEAARARDENAHALPNPSARLLQGRRQVAVAVVGAVLLAFGVASLIGKAADYHKILDGLEGARKQWFPLCLGGLVLKYAGYVGAYRGVAAAGDGPRLPYGLTTKIVAAGFGAMVIGTGAGTLAVDYWALRSAGAGHRGALARVLALNTLEWAVLGSAAAAAGAVLLVGLGADVSPAATLPWIVVVPLCFAVGRWVSAPSRSRRFTEGRPGRIGQLVGDAILGLVLLRALRLRPSRGGGWAVVGTAAYWAGDLLCLWGALRAFGVELGPAELVLAYATGYASTILPLPAGGAGSVDAAMTYALTLVGVPLVPALLGAVVYRVFTFWLPLLPALAVLPFLRNIRAELPTTPAARA